MQDLGSLGGDWSRALDINDGEQVVGNARNAASQNRAFLWENGQMKDLNNFVPADSGWALVSAEAINQRGQIVGFGVINGQTHAFLLTPLAYYWNNPNGGSWHSAANWDPQGVPGAGDTTIFALAGEYTVDASQPPATHFSPTSFSIDRMVISATATVNFNNLNLNLVFDSPTEPSLQVNDGGTANVNSGAATFSHATLGGLQPADPHNPPTARLQVFNSGTTLTGSGRLTIGDQGVGDLFVANGGQMIGAEARLGGEQPGTAIVGGDGSLWQTGNIAVGYGVSGTLTIENGGRVDSNTAVVSFGSGSFPSKVTVEGASSLWAVEGGLTLGQGAAGFVDVLNGGQLVVNQSVSIPDGLLKLDSHSATGDPSRLVVMDNLLVEGLYPEDGLLYMYDGARGEVYGDFMVGQGGTGNVFIFGTPGAYTLLSVRDPSSGACLIGREYAGTVLVSEHSGLSCRNVQLGLAGTTGPGKLGLYGSFLNVNEIVRVGQVGSGGGELEMLNATVTALEGMHIAPNGRVSGSGTIILGSAGLLNEGALSPGINIVTPPLAAALTATQGNVATVTITGALTISPTGRLEIPLIGSTSGQYGSLAVTGTAALDGVLALNFSQGFAPRQGDAFTFLTATGGVDGTFGSVAISGLAPGFAYELTYNGGRLTLIAVNDGVAMPGAPLQEVLLPLIAR
jgi:T5SS/PEP-CTERM-associated repeat protein/probable HAF family extracellular repeat protein